MDNASDFESEGCRFESCQVRNIFFSSLGRSFLSLSLLLVHICMYFSILRSYFRIVLLSALLFACVACYVYFDIVLREICTRANLCYHFSLLMLLLLVEFVYVRLCVSLRYK